MRFEVFTLVKIQGEVFWVVMMCGVVVVYKRFEDLAASFFRVKLMVVGRGIGTCMEESVVWQPLGSGNG
jgi:hypothetical protein